MAKSNYYKVPARDPVSGSELYVSELTSEDTGITIRGKFEIPSYARLDTEQARFLETFLRCRGMLNQVEKEMGISYPTVRSRLDNLLAALNLAPVKEERPTKPDKSTEQKRQILEELEKGVITAEEAKEKLGVLK